MRKHLSTIVLALWSIGMALGLLMLTNEHRALVEDHAATVEELAAVRSELDETERQLGMTGQWLAYALALDRLQQDMTPVRAQALLEAERRGLLKLRHKALLWEARQLGLAPEPLAVSDSTGR